MRRIILTFTVLIVLTACTRPNPFLNNSIIESAKVEVNNCEI